MQGKCIVHYLLEKAFNNLCVYTGEFMILHSIKINLLPRVYTLNKQKNNKY